MVFAFLGDIGGGELLLIMLVVLVFFGANRIPELARGLGKGIREFKDATNEIRSEIERAGESRPTPQATTVQAPPAPVSAPPVTPTTTPSATAE
ncbi:MAG TPA: twin-arginine translocase TatA/TatE family subunit [bacterium]|nr:twin-arginine translocase TatA/TatE family subunit [bacterium]